MEKEEIIRLAAQAAIDIWDKKNESKQDRVERRLRENTKKLLKDYKKLKAHVEQAIDNTCKSKPSDLKLVIAEIFDKKGYIRVRSIMESKERTEVMLSHIDRMLEVYQKECKEEASLKYELLRLYYIEHKTEAEILSTQPVGCLLYTSPSPRD